MLNDVNVAIVVYGNKSREIFDGYWVQDCSAATENILLATEDIGLGVVWLGVYPIEEGVNKLKKLLKLPEYVIPLSIIPIGYPDQNRNPKYKLDAKRIHYDKW